MKKPTRIVKENDEFGPAWDIFENGRAIACAHVKADAEAFALREISLVMLTRRNSEYEEKLRTKA